MLYTNYTQNNTEVLQRIQPFLGNSLKTNNGTRPAAMQQIVRDETVGLERWKRCFLRGPSREVISGTKFRA
jgi:hypothetical protein